MYFSGKEHLVSKEKKQKKHVGLVKLRFSG